MSHKLMFFFSKRVHFCFYILQQIVLITIGYKCLKTLYRFNQLQFRNLRETCCIATATKTAKKKNVHQMDLIVYFLEELKFLKLVQYHWKGLSHWPCVFESGGQRWAHTVILWEAHLCSSPAGRTSWQWLFATYRSFLMRFQPSIR